VALVQKNVVQVDRDISDRNPQQYRRATLIVRAWPALPGCPQDLKRGRGHADRVEGIVNSTRADGPDLIHRVGFRGVDAVRRAKLPGEPQLTVGQVHRDDGIGPGDGRGTDHRQADAADAAGAAYRHRLATPDVRRMQHRAGSGQHGAADEAGRIGGVGG
jgi:hypothetical protein